MRRRIWSETVPFETLERPELVALLARFGLAPLLAVRPGQAREAAAVLARYAGEGLAAGLWPMLDDPDGRWASAANATRFCAFARSLVEDVERHAGGGVLAELAVDLEPPIGRVRALLDRDLAGLDLASFEGASRRLAVARTELGALSGWLAARGVRTTAAVIPALLLDPVGAGDVRPAGFELALGTPVTGLAWDHVSVMLYSTMFEGWSHGLLRRPDARALLATLCASASTRFGPRAGASLGAVSTGALGDEPVYRGPAELADDTALARAAGVDDLVLFDLGGVLARPPAEAWLEAFVATGPAASLPAPTLRAQGAVAGARLAGTTLALLARTLRASGAAAR